MGKEISVKGYVSEDGIVEEGNTALVSHRNNEETPIIKLVKDVCIKVYSADEEIKKSDPKQFNGKVQLSIEIQEDGVVSFIIENQELKKQTKEYIGKYVCILIQIKE